MPNFNERRFVLNTVNASALGNNGLSFAISQNTFKWAAAFASPTGFTLAKVALYIHSVTGTPVAYDVRIETDNGSGRPSGTLAWANATAQIASGASAGWTSELSLTASGALTVGTIYHIVVQPATDPASANYISMRENGMVTSGSDGNLTYWTSRNSGSWAAGIGSPVFVCVSNDATPLRFGQVIDNSASVTPTNTVWHGMKFVCPVTGTYLGCTVEQLNSTSAGAVAAKIIDSGNNVLVTGTLAAGVFDALTSRSACQTFVFDTPITLTAGQTYRCVWKDPAGVWRIDCVICSSTYKTIKPGADQYIRTNGTSSDGIASPTTWTDTDTDEMCQFHMFASEFTGGGGGGASGGRRNMLGAFRVNRRPENIFGAHEFDQGPKVFRMTG